MKRIIKQRERLYILIFLFISLVVMWDLLKPGYIFALDMAFGPNYPQELLNNYVYGLSNNLSVTGASCIAKVFFSWITNSLSLVLPVWFSQKLLLILLLAFSGIGMYRLVPKDSRYGRYFAGIFYMVNPFIYVRYLAGSIFTIWGYALLPFVVKSLVDLSERPSVKNAIWVGIWFTLIAPAEHFLAMAMIVFIVFLTFSLFRKGNRARLGKCFLVAIVIFMLLNSSLIASVFSGEVEKTYQLTQISTKDFELFATSRDHNVFVNVGSLYGFWYSGYYSPKIHFLGWYFMLSCILLAAIYGFVTGIRGKHGRLYVKAIGIIALISLVLAVGVSSPYTSKLIYFLCDNFSPFRGFRETHKFAALLALAYAYLGSIGTSRFTTDIAGKIPRLVFVVFMCIVPLIYTYPMLFGFWGQLSSVDYPEDYYQVNSYFEKEAGDFNILFLPWHGFMTFNWVGRNIANPAEDFFTKTVIQADNIEMADVYSTSQNPVSNYVESLLEQRSKVENFGKFASCLNVRYIVLAKEVDYANYSFLSKQSDLALLMDTPNLIVFENKDWGHPVDVMTQAQLLGLNIDESKKIEDALSEYGTQKGNRTSLPGYVASGSLFIVLLGYLNWNHMKKIMRKNEGGNHLYD